MAPGSVVIEGPKGGPILSVKDWHKFAPPKSGAPRWRPGAVAFLSRFAEAEGAKGSSGWLVGPIRVPGEGRVPGDIPLWVGKLQTRI